MKGVHCAQGANYSGLLWDFGLAVGKGHEFTPLSFGPGVLTGPLDCNTAEGCVTLTASLLPHAVCTLQG